MKTGLSSRERMLAAITYQQPDYIPCSFMIFNALKARCRDYPEFIERQVALGLDAYVQLPPRPPVITNDHRDMHGLPVNHDPHVSIREWVENINGERYPLLVKEYHTPAGILRAEVRQTDDWPYGNHIPFLDDYITPRARKFPVTRRDDLPALRYLLQAPTASEIEDFRAAARPTLELAHKYGLLVTGDWSVGADLLAWVYGLQNMVYASFDQPEFLSEALQLIAEWDRQRSAVMLDSGIDLLVKRAWYENCDFFSPPNWKKFILPILAKDVELAHQAGAKFAYIITSNCMKLLDLIASSGVDVIIGADPHCWDFPKAKAILNRRVCLWGGVNGHLTVEQGAPEAVRDEVRHAIEVLAPGGGLILSPVDNIREYTPQAEANVPALLQEWRALRNL